MAELEGLSKTGFKQRIIGAIVLVSLAVIFLPMLFDEPHSDRVTRVIDVPQDPDLPEMRITAPQPPADGAGAAVAPVEEAGAADGAAMVTRADGGLEAPAEEIGPGGTVVGEPVAVESAAATPVEPAEKASSTSVSEATPAPVTPPAAVSAPEDGGFMVQLGSFGNKTNALALRDKVAGAGFSVHAEEVVVSGKTLTRVWVGPYATKTDAEKAKPGIDKLAGLASKVLSR